MPSENGSAIETPKASETEQAVRDFLEWLQRNNPPFTTDIADQIVKEFLVWRAERAMEQGVRRYVPVDGHDWHQEEEVSTETSG